MEAFLPYLIIVGALALACGIAVILYRGVRSATIGLKNSISPPIAYPARVVGKRTETSGRASQFGTFHGGYVETYYFVTFQFKNGERREYEVSGEEFGLAIEGDQGHVTVKGTRYEYFERA